MKVGILTFHRAHNYGAVLQCYALQEVLKSMGHDVEVIDYRQPFIEHIYSTYRKDLIKRYLTHPNALYKYLRLDIPIKKQRKSIFEYFIHKFLSLSKKCDSNSIPTNYDTIVIGSDQLWGVNCLGGKLDATYFGCFPKDKKTKTISYAISTNIKSLSSISNEELKKLTSNIDVISLREESMSVVLGNKIGKEITVCLDPTLICDSTLWNPLINESWKKKKYVLVYYVIRGFGEFAHKEILNKARQIAESIEAEVIDLSSMKFSVNDFISAFKYAQCVITSSFHATVFSVVFNRPLYSVKLHDGYDGRYVNLLENLGMSECLIEMDTEVDSIPHIDYENVNNRLLSFRMPSLNYLKNNL